MLMTSSERVSWVKMDASANDEVALPDRKKLCTREEVVRVSLKDKDGHPHTPIDLPASNLARCRYFQACMSEPWGTCKAPDQTQFDLQTPTSQHQPYERLFRLLSLNAVSPSAFSDIGDALNVLCVASHLLCDDWINASSQYLAGMPWAPSEEETIRSALGGLELPLCEDLRARLHWDKTSSIQGLQQLLEKLLAVNLRDPQRYPRCTRGTVSLWRNNLKGDCPHVANMARQLLYREWHKLCDELQNDRSSFKRWLWLCKMLLDVEEDEELIQTISLTGSCLLHHCFEDIECLILVSDILRRVAQGAVILSNAQRLGILKLAVKATASFPTHTRGSVVGNMIKILGTLPAADQADFFSVWIDTECNDPLYLTEEFENYCAKLRSFS